MSLRFPGKSAQCTTVSPKSCFSVKCPCLPWEWVPQMVLRRSLGQGVQNNHQILGLGVGAATLVRVSSSSSPFPPPPQGHQPD